MQETIHNMQEKCNKAFLLTS